MQKGRFYTNKSFFVAVIILLLIFFHIVGALSPSQSLIFRITSPLTSAFYRISTSIQGASDRASLSKHDLVDENQRLKNELNTVLTEKAELELLKDENQALKQIVDFIEEEGYEYKIARIVAREPTAEVEALIINKGRDDGIRKNQAVLSEDGIVIGKVYQVNSKFSTVLLLMDKHAKLAVTIMNEERTMGLLEGSFGLVAQVNLIPRDARVNPGDLIITSGTEKNIPNGLVVGQVEEIFEQPDQLFKSVKIKQLVNPDRLSLVNVIIQLHD